MRFLISLSCYVAVFAVLLRCVSLSSVAAVFRRFLPCCPLVPPFPSSSERPCRLPRPAGIVPLRFKFAAWLRDSSRLLQPSPRYTQSCRFAAALMPTAQQFTHMSPVIQLLPGARRSVASRTLRRTAERASFWHMATRTARYPSRIRIRPDGWYPEPAARGCARTRAWRMRSATARSTTSVIS